MYICLIEIRIKRIFSKLVVISDLYHLYQQLVSSSKSCFLVQVQQWTEQCKDQNWVIIFGLHVTRYNKISSYTKRPNEKATTKTFCNTKTYKNEKKWKTWEYHVRYFDTHAWLMTLNQKSFSKIWSLHH